MKSLHFAFDSRSIRVRVLLFQRFDAFASGFIVSIL